MTSSKNPRVLVIGIGNQFRGDDAVGLLVAHSLKERFSSQCDAVEEPGDGAHLMELWKNSQVTILVDAVKSGAEPGQIHRHEADRSPLPASLFHHSTHTFGIPQAIELARTLNQIPQKLIIYGIEGTCFNVDSSVSEPVMQAALKVVESIVRDVIQYQPLTSPTLT